MRVIARFVDIIKDELCSAKDYAEMYVEAKAKNDSRANRFKQMSLEELGHAEFFHEVALDKIAELENVFVVPVEMQEKLDESHKKFVEKDAWIRQMLSM